jgi:hypothetical protein
VRYAGIRRRTLAAEALRANRDSARARADRIRERLGSRAALASPSRRDNDAADPRAGPRRAARRSIDDATLTLSLAPGAWWIGIARAGQTPNRYDSVFVERGAVDTIRLRPPGAP